MCKTLQGRSTFGTLRCRFCVGVRKGFCTFPKVSKMLKREGTTWQAWDSFEEDMQKMHFAWQAQYKRHMSSDMLGGQALVS